MTNSLFEVYQTNKRLIEMEGTFNFRDLGGYPTKDGKRVCWGKLFRSGKLSGMTIGDLALINQMGIKTICDLRGKDEVSQHPNPKSEGIEWLHIPVVPDDEQKVRQIGDLANPQRYLYKSEPGEMLTVLNRQMATYIRTYQRIFAVLLEAPEAPFLFHCMAGKDRTGVVAALILSVLGVSREVIVEDYLHTNRSQEKIKANLKGDLDNDQMIDKAVLDALLEARVEYIMAFFDEIETKHGTVEAFLNDAIGLRAEEIEILRNRFLE